MPSGKMGKLTFWKVVFGLITVAGLYATYVRFFKGLGAATHLSDQFPWGLWIGFDVMVGVGLAAGGFVVAATVHVFRIEKYEPIARPTILTAFLGYNLVCVALLFDIGHPYRLWHPLVMWNPHSVMFEVAWCVTLYTTVLTLEFSPIVFEKLGWKRPLKWVEKAFLPVVVVGVLLSTMHQSSLGTLYVIAPDKLHGLWYSPLLPVFFFVSAIAAGLTMTIFESFMSWRAFGKRLETELLDGLARVTVVVLAVYAVLRIQDLFGRGNLGLAFQMTPEAVLFWGEMGLGVFAPIVLFVIPAVRRNEQGLFFAATLTILGFVLNRLNVSITGMAGSSGTNYFPSWMEVAVTVMIVAFGFVFFGLAVKYLPIFSAEHEMKTAPSLPAAFPRHAFQGRAILGLWVFLLVGVVGIGLAVRNRQTPGFEPSAILADPPGASEAIAEPDVSPEIRALMHEHSRTLTEEVVATLRMPQPFAFRQNGDSPGPVTFLHSTHIRKGNTTCRSCHESFFSITEVGRPVAGGWTEERIHSGDLCQSCHNGTHAFGTDECDRCHRQP
jgi:c(7)-type cytochrome triheme protein